MRTNIILFITKAFKLILFIYSVALALNLLKGLFERSKKPFDRLRASGGNCALFIVLCHIFVNTTLYCNQEQFNFQPIEEYSANDKPVLDYQSFDQLFKHANNLFVQDRYDEAVELYKQALGLNPTCAQAFFNMGQSLYKAKKYPEALQAFKHALRYKKDHIRAYTQIGNLMIDVRQPADAIAPLKQALSLNPKDSKVRLLLARAYNDKHLFSDALEVVTQGIMLDPSDINLTFELANIYNTLNQLEESLRIYKELDAYAPKNPSILYNIAFTLKKMGNLEGALPYYNQVLELNPNHAEALFSRGLAYLVIGDFEKGWEGYEWRYSRPSQGSIRTYTAPRWDGSDLTGKTILLHAEQGFGDTFQFIRYAKLVKEKNGTVIAAVQKALVTLMRLCPYIDSVISTDDTPPPFDVHAPLMSLPYILKTKIDTIPSEFPYIFADENLTQYWKEKLSHDKNFKIGICWQGNSNYATPLLRATVALKSIEAQQFARLCTVPGISLYSLQKTTGTDQLENLPKHMKIITFDDNTFDQANGRFMDTAAVMKNLDLIITVDTSIGHLSSAMEIPTWVMVPNPPDWRWMINRADTPWYPNMRLFRQPTPGDWDSVLRTITQELQKKVGDKESE